MLLNQFVSAAVSSLTTNSARRKENHLPALYQQLFLLLNKFPGDVARFRLALTLIIAHQRLRDAPVPVNDDLSAFHRQLRRTADHVISAGSDDKRRRYFTSCWRSLMSIRRSCGSGRPRRRLPSRYGDWLNVA